MSDKPQRRAPNATNTPVVVTIQGVKSISKERAEAILTKFITVSEQIAAGDYQNQRTGLSDSVSNKPVMGQLQRMQRNLRGLPPLAGDNVFGKHKLEDEPPKNKKIKFDDAEESGEKDERIVETELKSESSPEGSGDSDASESDSL